MLFQPTERISGRLVAAVWVVGIIVVLISSAIAWDGGALRSQTGTFLPGWISLDWMRRRDLI